MPNSKEKRNKPMPYFLQREKEKEGGRTNEEFFRSRRKEDDGKRGGVSSFLITARRCEKEGKKERLNEGRARINLDYRQNNAI